MHSTIVVTTVFGFLNIFVVARLGTSITSAVDGVISFNNSAGTTLVTLYTTLFSVIMCDINTSLLNVPASRDRDLVTNLSKTTVTVRNNVNNVGVNR